MPDLNCPTFQAQIARLSLITKNWGGGRPPPSPQPPPPPRTPMFDKGFDTRRADVAFIQSEYVNS